MDENNFFYTPQIEKRVSDYRVKLDEWKIIPLIFEELLHHNNVAKSWVRNRQGIGNRVDFVGDKHMPCLRSVLFQ